MMNLTGRLGQASAAALGCDNNGDTRKSAAAKIENAQAGFAGLLMDPPGGPGGHSSRWPLRRLLK